MIIYHNDGKGKSSSYEVRYIESDDFGNSFYKKHPDVSAIIMSHSIDGVIGYGSTKEEAIRNYREALEYFMEELKAIEKLYLYTDFIDNNIVEADCFGNVTQKENMLINPQPKAEE